MPVYKGWDDYWVMQRNRKFTRWLSIVVGIMATALTLFAVFHKASAAEIDKVVMPRPGQVCMRRVDKYSHRLKWCWNDYVCYKSRYICNRSLRAQLQFEKEEGRPSGP
jgi:hypothetical protein